MASDASGQQEESTFEDRIETLFLLSDPAKNMILQKLGLDDLANKDLANSEDTEERLNWPTLEPLVNFTTNGKFVCASWPQVPVPFWMAPYFPANSSIPGCGYGPIFVPPGFYPAGIWPDGHAGLVSEEPAPSGLGARSAGCRGYNWPLGWIGGFGDGGIWPQYQPQGIPWKTFQYIPLGFGDRGHFEGFSEAKLWSPDSA